MGRRSLAIAPAASGEDERQIGEAGVQVHEPETADRAAAEVTEKQRPERRKCGREVVAVPEHRPWQDDEE